VSSKQPVLSKHKLKEQAWVMQALGGALAGTLRAWMSTLRVRLVLNDERVDPRGGATGSIFCVWHETILFLGHYYRDCGMHVMISRSTDGEIVARTVECLGFKAIRGSTGRGGDRAVRELLRNCQAPNLVLTPDGPKGPRREFQRGAVYLASRLQMPLVAVGCGFDRPWRMGSWDQLVLPRPFSQAVVCATEGIQVPANADDAVLESYRQKLEHEMLAMTAKAEGLATRWAQGRPWPGENAERPPAGPAVEWSKLRRAA
jgi:lysophospholipid acyltransferase (LPLAT)-like uncharacterized protein